MSALGPAGRNGTRFFPSTPSPGPTSSVRRYSVNKMWEGLGTAAGLCGTLNKGTSGRHPHGSGQPLPLIPERLTACLPAAPAGGPLGMGSR